MFDKVTIIGIGMIGSSIARVIKKEHLAKKLVAYDVNLTYLKQALELKICDEVQDDLIAAVKDAELIIYASPVGTYSEITRNIVPHLKDGTIITDVGSVKRCAIRDVEKHITDESGIVFVAGHPVAGIEKSGPEVGFAEMFEDRWFIITPSARSTEEAITKISKLWAKAKMKIDIMTPKHHDKVMAAVSHLPHLIAFSIVGTVADLEGYEQQEIIKYSASGFRDFTRIAGSDPTMWRDIFLNNKETILELIQRFVEDLIALQRNIRWNEGDELFKLFSRTQKIRKEVIEAKQHQMEEEKRLTNNQK
ncbi:MAG: prephenate/arogenate dehydrogenase family protein [Alphaproteobacteria bacterium]|nr:prephenate/arogenate dehydrogenase family protein [Alphaproteobacteria bacterium]